MNVSPLPRPRLPARLFVTFSLAAGAVNVGLVVLLRNDALLGYAHLHTAPIAPPPSV